MRPLPEQFSAVRTSQFDAQLKFMSTLTRRAVEGTEQLLALNIRTARASLEKSSAAVRQLAAVKDPRDLIALASQTQAGFESALAYSRELFGIAAAVQALPPPAASATAPAAAAAPASAPQSVEPGKTPVAAAPAAALTPAAEPAPVPAASATPIARAASRVAAQAPAARPAAAPLASPAAGPVAMPRIKPVEAAPPPVQAAGQPAPQQRARAGKAAKKKAAAHKQAPQK